MQSFGPPTAVAPGHRTSVKVRPDGTHYLALPPGERQLLINSCWAAATASWQAVDPLPEARWIQEDIISECADPQHFDGRIERVGLVGTFAEYFQLDYHEFNPRMLKATDVGKRLRSRGYVLLIFNIRVYELVPGSSVPRLVLLAHTHLVYGVGYPDGHNLKISVMDPDTGGHVNKDEAFYWNDKDGKERSGNIMLMYPKLGYPNAK